MWRPAVCAVGHGEHIPARLVTRRGRPVAAEVDDLIGYLGALRDLCAEIDADGSGLERAPDPVALSAKLE
jgi:hypothetical protein